MSSSSNGAVASPVLPGLVPGTHDRGANRSGRFIGDVVVELGFAERGEVEKAIAVSRASGRRTGHVLLENGTLTPDQLARVIAERFGVDYVDLAVFKVDMTAVNVVSVAAARRYEAFPIHFLDERTLLVAMSDPGNVLAVDDISLMTGYEVRPAAASREDVLAFIARLYQLDDVVVEEGGAESAELGADVTDLRESADDAPVIKLVHSLIAQGVDQGASDIHFEPRDGGLAVRFRIDGVLSEATHVPRRLTAGVVSRIKIMSDLDIAERRAPQDGRLSLTIDGRHIDVRVATLPLVGGESAVLRVLDKGATLPELGALGLQPDARATFQDSFQRAHGAILVTGPTGSGKTTTLYGALGVLHTPEKNIITIEDPVEYELSGVKQMQVNLKAGVTFGSGLRSMMRADPDVIMVGEIRDHETAQIAIEAALTGHLVLSTLHTNDAPAAIARLIDMGIEPFLVASAVECVVAQRLARTLCSHCRREVTVDGDVARAHGFRVEEDALQVCEAVGCTRCGHSGYRGRLGLYEVMPVTEEIRQLIVRRAPAGEIAGVATAAGMRRMREDGLDKVLAGETSFAEVARVTC
ncbi:MAG TPA: ATPase, T2SS/T4P/T4SS family [Solirubrobacteraceae bacterium]